MKKTEEIFLELIKVGLWEKTLPIPPLEGGAFNLADIDWEGVYQHVVAQTMVGVVADGMATVGMKELQVPKEVKLKTLQQVMRIEEGNEKMNTLLPLLYKKLKKSGLKPCLLKGQGVAQCYPQPNHRQSGDIDLFCYRQEDYEKAKDVVSKVAQHIGGEEDHRKHFDCTIEEIVVELHGDIKTQIKKKTDQYINTFIHNHFDNYVDLKDEHLGCYLAPPNFDALFIFVHMLQHYFNSGIGLRQVCDWLVFLNHNYEKIDTTLLKEDIQLLGLMKEWQVFGNMAVNMLGYPQEKMPFYLEKYMKEGKITLKQIMKAGNFGRNMYLKDRPKNYILGKLYTFYKNNMMRLGNLLIFPQEAIYGIPFLIKDGIKRL